MSKNYYIADMHFSHKNILAYDNRPFFTVSEMDKTMIDRWNSVVAKNDSVYVLGDMFWCTEKEAISILDKLNGAKILILGNHDTCNNEEFRQRFVHIADYLEVSDKGRKVVLSHYPIPCFKNHYYKWYHLYGHVHNSFEYNMMEHNKFLMQELYGKPCLMYNVGAMMPWMDYTPRTLDEIIDTAGAEDAAHSFESKNTEMEEK